MPVRPTQFWGKYGCYRPVHGNHVPVSDTPIGESSVPETGEFIYYRATIRRELFITLSAEFRI